MIAKRFGGFRDFRVIGSDCSRFAARSEVLAGIEAERCRPSHRTCGSPAIQLSGKILGAMGLACVLNHDQVVLFGELENRIHVGDLAVEMNGNDGRHRPPAAKTDQLP